MVTLTLPGPCPKCREMLLDDVMCLETNGSGKGKSVSFACSKCHEIRIEVKATELKGPLTLKKASGIMDWLKRNGRLICSGR